MDEEFVPISVNDMYESDDSGGGGGGGTVEPMIVEVIESEDETTGAITYTLDKTFNEIKSAFVEGKIVLLLKQTTTVDGSEIETYLTIAKVESEIGDDFAYYTVISSGDYRYETTDPDEYPSFSQNDES